MLFNEIKQQVTNQMAALELEQAKVSKEVKWKVDDCQNLLKSRVNETYVKDYVKLVQTQLLDKVSIIHHLLFSNR